MNGSMLWFNEAKDHGFTLPSAAQSRRQKQRRLWRREAGASLWMGCHEARCEYRAVAVGGTSHAWGMSTAPAELVDVGLTPLTRAQVVSVARHDAAIRLTDEALLAMKIAREQVEVLANGSLPAYGISTGFGALATKHIP